jgi:hypothetical protein
VQRFVAANGDETQMIGARTRCARIDQLALQAAQSGLVRRIRERQKLRIAVAAAQPFEKRRQVTLVAPMIAIDRPT